MRRGPGVGGRSKVAVHGGPANVPSFFLGAPPTLPRSRFSSSGGLACSPSRTNDGRKTTDERVHFYASKSVATCLLHGRGHMHDSPVTHVSVFVTFDLDPSLPSPLINESESSSLRQCSCGCGDYLLPYPLGSSTRL
jgi:hypothetical protein